MAKYQPLADHLAALKDATWRASFADIERVLGFELPKSARSHPAWWSNEGAEGRPHKRAWLDHGWRVEEIDLDHQSVAFRRDDDDDAAPPAIQDAVKAYERRRRALRIGRFALGGGALAAAVGLIAGAGAFMLGRLFPRK